MSSIDTFHFPGLDPYAPSIPDLFSLFSHAHEHLRTVSPAFLRDTKERCRLMSVIYTNEGAERGTEIEYCVSDYQDHLNTRRTFHAATGALLTLCDFFALPMTVPDFDAFLSAPLSRSLHAQALYCISDGTASLTPESTAAFAAYLRLIDAGAVQSYSICLLAGHDCTCEWLRPIGYKPSDALCRRVNALAAALAGAPR